LQGWCKCVNAFANTKKKRTPRACTHAQSHIQGGYMHIHMYIYVCIYIYIHMKGGRPLIFCPCLPFSSCSFYLFSLSFLFWARSWAFSFRPERRRGGGGEKEEGREIQREREYRRERANMGRWGTDLLQIVCGMILCVKSWAVFANNPFGGKLFNSVSNSKKTVETIVLYGLTHTSWAVFANNPFVGKLFNTCRIRLQCVRQSVQNNRLQTAYDLCVRSRDNSQYRIRYRVTIVNTAYELGVKLCNNRLKTAYDLCVRSRNNRQYRIQCARHFVSFLQKHNVTRHVYKCLH